MVLKKWDELPQILKNENVKHYYNLLERKRFSLYFKRTFDFIVAIIILIILLPFFIIISIAIKIDSKGPIMYRQIRVTQYGKTFKIFKFRTMINDADSMGTQVTVKNDNRVTKVGKFLRKVKLDEIPQLFNIILGEMSFVGTRPETVNYVGYYSDSMLATLLLPAGITSEASIQYKDEELLLTNVDDADDIYISVILPSKMKYNLDSIENFSFLSDIKTMIRTVLTVAKKGNYEDINN